jgi:restriction endonuclease S subunit
MLITTGVPFNINKIKEHNSFQSNIVHQGMDTAGFFDTEFDFLFMNPPYGGDKTKGKEYRFKYSSVQGKGKEKEKTFHVNKEIQSIGIEDDDKVSAGVQLAMATLSKKGGVCCIVLPQGFFFGNSKKLIELRRRLIDDFKVHYIVDIASGEFANTGTKTSMLVFESNIDKTGTIRFLDMNRQVVAQASHDKLTLKRYNLNGTLYKVQETEQWDNMYSLYTLDSICEVRYGKRITKEKDAGTLYPVYGGGGICTYRTDNCNRDGITFKISRDGMSEENCVMMLHGQFWLNDTGLSLHSLTKNMYTEKYVGFWCLQNKKYVYKICSFEGTRGTAQIHIDIDSLKSLQIPLPPLEIQERIVKPIDAWMGMAQAEEKLVDQLEKAVICQIEVMSMNAPRVRLGDVVQIEHGQRITKKDHEGTLYAVYGSGGVTFKTDNFNRDGMTCKIGRFAVSQKNMVQILHGTYWLNDSGFTIKGSNGNMDYFVWYTLLQQSQQIYEQCAQGRGTAQENIDMNMFKDMVIPLPSFEEQQKLQPMFDEIKNKKNMLEIFAVNTNLRFRDRFIFRLPLANT